MSAQFCQSFSKRLQSQLQIERYKAPEFMTLLNDIASTTQDIYLDFEGLCSRFGSSTDYRGPHRVLDDLYQAHADLVVSAMRTTNAFRRYLAACNRVFDSTTPLFGRKDYDPATAFANFDEQYEMLRASIVMVAAHWDKTGAKVQHALGICLRRRKHEWVLWAESLIFPWSPDSQCVALRTDLPGLVKRARGHLDAFGDLYESLQRIGMQIESERVDAPDVPPDIDHIVYTIRLISYLLILFMDCMMEVNRAAGRGPDTPKHWEID
ncbi:hypothetical protein B0H19DRAFT_110853 [Mycena capillaripes]|nr:hypothetical protein B0H19DRAFT_110853 [Mycena capillaripes]